MDVLVLIRHPAAFVGSILKQGWDHDFAHFLAQPLMMRDQLGSFEDEIRRYAEEPQPRLDQAILLWNLIHHQIRRFREERPAWDFRSATRISRASPSRASGSCTNGSGLTWTDEVQRTIETHSGEGNPDVTTDAASHQRDSRRAITAWKARLSPEEIERIRTADRRRRRGVLHRCDW